MVFHFARKLGQLKILVEFDSGLVFLLLNIIQNISLERWKSITAAIEMKSKAFNCDTILTQVN